MLHRSSFGLDAHPSTLVDLLRWRAQHQPDQRIYTFLVDGATEEVCLTYAELDRQAHAIAMQLRDLAAVGTRALLLYPPGLDYIAAFFGCLYAGVVAIPAYPPDPARLTRTLPRLNAVVQDARPALLLTTASILALSEALIAHAPDLRALRWLATDMLVPSSEAAWQELSGATMALLQYTSGSTAAPKGVMLSHSNLLHNSALIARGFGHTSESRGVIWLPPYHDMGLIGGILQPLYANFPVTLMSPLDFLQRPVGWLQAITRYGATTSGGPNFAYDLCVRKVTPEQRASLDLSSWTVAFNGAEPVRSETLDRFAATFAPCGFRRAAFYSCYGLAEATLIVTGGSVDVPPIVHTFAGDALEQNRVVVAPTEVDGARALVSVGRCLPDQQIVIVDSDCGRLCSPDRVGEIWLAGPGVALGYWNRSVETQQTFRAVLADTGAGSFLRTGDLGFVYDGELFVTGRLKDLIIIRGRNHYPQDIELTVERSHAALRPGAVAAFAVEIAGEERLVVVQEIARRARQVPIAEVVRAIRQAVAAAHEVPVYAVALLKPGSIPKTASGKIQRHTCRLGFLAGTLEEVGRSLLDERATAADAVVGADMPELNGSVLRELNVADQTAVLATYMRQRAARVLGVAPDHLDPQQPLSALGLDSLLAIELQHTIEAETNIVVSMVDMLQGASVAQLAHQARAALATALPPSAPLPVAEQASTAAHPLSHGQRALWFLHQLAPESAAYHIASAMCIHGTLNISALRHAFQALIDHHPGLRTTFAAADGEPTQQVHPHAEVGFAVEDARAWPTATLDARLAAAAYRPFDLAHGPLLRVHLFERAPRQHVLLLVVHHLVADLWSLALLVHELGQHYVATLAASPPPAWPPAPSYSAFVHWQRDQLAGAVGAQLMAYWRAQLADLPTRLALPSDRPRPPIQTYRGAAHVAWLDEAVTARLRGAAAPL
jgi:acyl-CoA synthetase (AMP-forming)/AMP-acid ligase II/aryl carrier-like protein